MLTEHPLDTMLLVTDLDAARQFYGERMGLEVLLEDPGFLTFACGEDTRLVVTASTQGTADCATQASWRVTDIGAEVTGLRDRGIAVLDLPEVGTEDGIADVGFALAAWIEDPFGNSLGLLQIKDAA